MTDAEIFTRYLAIETEANRTIEGVDPQAIIDVLASELGIPVEHITAIVLDQTVAGPC